MFENVDGRTDDRVTGILIAHLRAFGSGELKSYLNSLSGFIVPNLVWLVRSTHQFCVAKFCHITIMFPDDDFVIFYQQTKA